MLSSIITLAIGGAAVYFFYEYSFLIGTILFTWFLSRLFGYNIKRLFEGINHSEAEKLSNVFIELKINVAGVLNHKTSSVLFEKMRENKKFASRFNDRSEWVKLMTDNFKRKYKNENDIIHEEKRYLWDAVKFNIKNNILWQNGQIDFSDSIEHEVFIPYEYKSEKDEEDNFWHDIGRGIRIRTIVVNGLIKVQLGNFDKETTPEFYKESGLAVYKTWETISTFPLMYISQSIPVHYLNLSAYATDSYKHLLKGDSKDWLKDWKELNAEIRDYNYLKTHFTSDEHASSKFNKVYKVFYTKGHERLEAENFVDPYKRKNDDWSVSGWMEDNNIHYMNDYLQVFIADYKDYKEKKERYYLTDFHEERP